MTATFNPGQFLTGNDHTGRVSFRFPTGVNASVIPDAQRPLLWEVLVRFPDRTPVTHDWLGGDGLAAGLSTERAMQLLADVAGHDTRDCAYRGCGCQRWQNELANARRVAES